MKRASSPSVLFVFLYHGIGRAGRAGQGRAGMRIPGSINTWICITLTITFSFDLFVGAHPFFSFSRAM